MNPFEVEIDRLKAEIEKWEEVVADRDFQIDTLQDEIRELESEIEDLRIGGGRQYED